MEAVVLGKEIFTTLMSGSMPTEQVVSLFISKVRSNVPGPRCKVAIYGELFAALFSRSQSPVNDK